MFEVKVDDSVWRSVSLPRLMSFSHLSSATGRPGTAGSQTLSGKQIATELTNELNKSFGDDNVFDFAALNGQTLTIKRYPVMSNCARCSNSVGEHSVEWRRRHTRAG